MILVLEIAAGILLAHVVMGLVAIVYAIVTE